MIARDDYDGKGRSLREERTYAGAGWERDAEEEKRRRLREERQSEYAAYLATSNARKKGDVSHKPTQIDPRNGLTKAESYKQESVGSSKSNTYGERSWSGNERERAEERYPERNRGRDRDLDRRDRERDRDMQGDNNRYRELERDGYGDRDREWNKGRDREQEMDRDYTQDNGRSGSRHREGDYRREPERQGSKERVRDHEIEDRERAAEDTREKDSHAHRRSREIDASDIMSASEANKLISDEGNQKRSTGRVSSLHGGRSETQAKSEKDKRDMYAKDLALQMEATRLRKEEEKLKIQKEEERKWKEIQSYNPWGKPGAGAPAAKQAEPFGAIVPRDTASPPSRIADSSGPSFSPQNSLPVPVSSSFSPPSNPLMNTHPEGGRKFMGALSSMSQSEAELNAHAEKKLQYRRDLEEQMRLKEATKVQDPLSIQRPTPRAQQAADVFHSMSSTMEQAPQAPQLPQAEKTDVSPKFARIRFDQMDGTAQEEKLRKQRERQEHMEALQKQLAEKRRLQEMEKQREDEKFSRIYRANEEPSKSEKPDPVSEVAAPVSDLARPPAKPATKLETKTDPTSDGLEVKAAKDPDSKPSEKPSQEAEEKSEKKRHSGRKPRRHRRRSRRVSSEESGTSEQSEEGASTSGSGSGEEDGSSEDDRERRRLRRRHHHRRRSRGKTPDEATLALVKQAIEEEQAKLQRILLLQQQQQLQLQQQQLQLQQQLIAPPLYKPSLPQPEVVEPGKTAAKPPPILNSARKHFLAQIDPDTVLANGKVVIAKIDKHTSSLSTQTAARPHTTTGAFYNPTASEKTSKKESISSQLSSTIPERPGTSSAVTVNMERSTTTVSRAAAERRPLRNEGVRQSLSGESSFIFPIKENTNDAFAIFGDNPDKSKMSALPEDSSSALGLDLKEGKEDLRTVDPIFKDKAPAKPMFVVVPHLPYDPSFHDEVALKRDKKKKQKDLSPSLPVTHRGPRPDGSAVVSSKSTMDIDTLYKMSEKRLRNLQKNQTITEETIPISSPPEATEEVQLTARTRAKPAKFMWDLVSPEGRDIQTPHVFTVPSTRKLWDL